MESDYYKCKICGQVVNIVEKTGVPLFCCGQEIHDPAPSNENAGSQNKDQ